MILNTTSSPWRSLSQPHNHSNLCCLWCSHKCFRDMENIQPDQRNYRTHPQSSSRKSRLSLRRWSLSKCQRGSSHSSSSPDWLRTARKRKECTKCYRFQKCTFPLHIARQPTTLSQGNTILEHKSNNSSHNHMQVHMSPPCTRCILRPQPCLRTDQLRNSHMSLRPCLAKFFQQGSSHSSRHRLRLHSRNIFQGDNLSNSLSFLQYTQKCMTLNLGCCSALGRTLNMQKTMFPRQLFHTNLLHTEYSLCCQQLKNSLQRKICT